LLKPDVEDYEFDRYFEINSFTGVILPNQLAPTHDQQRAQCTIDLYGLNGFGRPEDRQRELACFAALPDPDINKRSFRFYLRREKLNAELAIG
jgi:hypothetical protein